MHVSGDVLFLFSHQLSYRCTREKQLKGVPWVIHVSHTKLAHLLSSCGGVQVSTELSESQKSEYKASQDCNKTTCMHGLNDSNTNLRILKPISQKYWRLKRVVGHYQGLYFKRQRTFILKHYFTVGLRTIDKGSAQNQTKRKTPGRDRFVRKFSSDFFVPFTVVPSDASKIKLHF